MLKSETCKDLTPTFSISGPAAGNRRRVSVSRFEGAEPGVLLREDSGGDPIVHFLPASL